MALVMDEQISRPRRVLGHDVFQTGRPKGSTNCCAIASAYFLKFAAIAVMCRLSGVPGP